MIDRLKFNGTKYLIYAVICFLPLILAIVGFGLGCYLMIQGVVSFFRGHE